MPKCLTGREDNLRRFGVRVAMRKPADRGHARPRTSDIPSRAVGFFNVQNLNMIDAMLQLGQEQRIPIGIEYIDALLFEAGSPCMSTARQLANCWTSSRTRSATLGLLSATWLS